MNDVKDVKIYFASPWFSPDQAEREDRVKRKLRELGFNVWSPKDNCVCSPGASEEVREKVFNDNIYNIETCDVIFAITDGKDMGTIWEAGFACGINYMLTQPEDRITIVYYCETLGPNGQFNLMLAQSGDIIITKFEDLDKLPSLLTGGEKVAYTGHIE